jgi:signal transduction histidine kinase
MRQLWRLRPDVCPVAPEAGVVPRGRADDPEGMDALQRGTDASNYFATLSHELRTPLTSVLGYVELVLDDDRLGDEHRRHLEVAHRCGERMVAAIEELLTPEAIERLAAGGATGPA